MVRQLKNGGLSSTCQSIKKIVHFRALTNVNKKQTYFGQYATLNFKEKFWRLRVETYCLLKTATGINGVFIKKSLQFESMAKNNVKCPNESSNENCYDVVHKSLVGILKRCKQKKLSMLIVDWNYFNLVYCGKSHLFKLIFFLTNNKFKRRFEQWKL